MGPAHHVKDYKLQPKEQKAFGKRMNVNKCDLNL